MKIKVIRTNQMTKEQKKSLCTLFENVFGTKKTYQQFISQFEKNELGFSYFGLAYQGEQVVGSYAVIPLTYNYLGEAVIFGQSVDTMVEKDYRGNPFFLKRLAERVYKKLEEDGIHFVFGFPNDNIYLVRKKILKWNDIDNLDIHLLPIKIGAFKKWFRAFDPLLKMLINILNSFVSKNIDLSEDFKIYKQYSLQYENYRYDDSYIKINFSKDIYFIYKIQTFKKVNTAFLVDIFPLTKKNIENSVKKINDLENQIDLIAYFGFLPFKPINLFKIPEKFKPKNTYMSGRVLNTTLIKSDIFDIKCWRVNLSNFDWI